MRYSTLYVESVAKWTVVDTLSDGFALEFFDTERDAHFAAKFEEFRWNCSTDSCSSGDGVGEGDGSRTSSRRSSTLRFARSRTSRTFSSRTIPTASSVRSRIIDSTSRPT